MKKNELIKFDSINYMRGIAILMVILVHTSHQIEGEYAIRKLALYGFTGVQMFFVASAFTLCYSIDSRKENNYINYFARRFFRIAPLYWFGIIIYFVINLMAVYFNFENKTGHDYNLPNILANTFLVHGLVPSANNNIVPGGWSIGTEVLFYIIFPFIFIMYKKNINKTSFIFMIPFLGLTLTLIYQYFSSKYIGFYRSDASFFYYNLLNQLPVFLIGMSLYGAYKKNILIHIGKIQSLLGFVFFTLVSLVLLTRGLNTNQYIDALVPFFSGLSFAFLFIFIHYHFRLKIRFLSNLGIYSYSSYILHFIFAVYLSTWLRNILYFIPKDLLFIVLFALSVICTYLFAKITYKYIELPFNRLGKKIINKYNK